MGELQQQQLDAGGKVGEPGVVNLPSMEIARTFAVETIDYPHPLGVHQVHRYIQNEALSLDEWCPEYKLCREDNINE